MIRVKDLVARSRRPAVSLGPLSFELDSGGRYALVGGRQDGGPLLLSILAGLRARVSGEAWVLGEPPRPRSQLAYVPLDVDLPAALLVGELLSLSLRIRTGHAAPPAERLALLGVETLSHRRIGSLTRGEAHAVALVEALTSSAGVVLLEEPLLSLDPRAFARVKDALASASQAGATVLIATASAEDARELTTEQLYLVQGKLAQRSVPDEAWNQMTSERPRLSIRCEEARTLLTALATEPTFTEIDSQGTCITVAGTDAVAMARSLAQAVRNTGVELDFIEFQRPGSAS